MTASSALRLGRLPALGHELTRQLLDAFEEYLPRIPRDNKKPLRRPFQILDTTGFAQ